MKREEVIKCIHIGYEEQIEDMKNEDNEDYNPTYKSLPINGNEAQYAYEFGIMLAREEMGLDLNEVNDYLEQILYDSDSKLTISDLV